MAYDGSGRRISKTRWVKSANSQDWEKELVTHYTGIGTEIRESFTGANADTKVVVNMPNGLGRYGIEDAVQSAEATASQKFEWYLKNHLGSTMLVYGTVASTNPNEADVGEKIAAYDYRSFGEMVELTPPPTGKVTENFTGKEHDDEIALNYFGARYLDPMLGMWTSVDPARQFASPYLYVGNGMNPVNAIDPDGSYSITKVDEKYAGAIGEYHYHYASYVETLFFKIYDIALPGGSFIISSKPDYEIENSLRPEKTSSLFSAVVDLLNFIPFLRPATVPLSTAEKSMKKVGVGNTLYSAVSIEGNPFFENFMSQLTSSNGIYGSSIEEVKTKAAWANAYGWELYKNDVKITDDIKRAYGEAYQSKFGNNDE